MEFRPITVDDEAELKRFERYFSTALRKRGDHDHGHWAQPHYLFKKFEPIHVRHFDVERDDVGVELLDHRARNRRLGWQLRFTDVIDRRIHVDRLDGSAGSGIAWSSGRVRRASVARR